MEPINFKEANKNFIKPDSMTDEECGSLPAYQDEKYLISCWRPSIKERIKLLFAGKIWAWIYGQNQPPISLGCKSPFNKKGE